MARDMNGRELKIGDMVIVPAVVEDFTDEGDMLLLAHQIPDRHGARINLPADPCQLRLAGGLERHEFENAAAAAAAGITPVIPPHVEHGEPVG